MTASNVVQLPVAFNLARIRCATCGRLGCTIVLMEDLPRFWCSVACAEPAGWPWLKPREKAASA